MSDDTDVIVIRFPAQVFSLRTLVDGGWRLALDGSGNLEAFTELMRAKKPGILLEVAAVVVKVAEEKPTENYVTKKRERYPYKADA
jgi:hypothetical protein